VERLKERLQTAARALATLDPLARLASPTDVERDAAIQRFEYSFEVLWKAGQRYLSVAEGLDTASPKQVVRLALSAGLLDEGEAHQALQMVDDRNLTSHTYNEELAKLIFSRLGAYAGLMTAWLERMQRRLAEGDER
jgi:nucleotidyltransferase substrate binding protein (TIGR01987 family)